MRADGSLEELAATGLILGIIPLAVYSSASTQLAAQDRLVLFSDGITEAANGDDALYGSARLRAALAGLGVDPSADAITRHVREDVGAFVAGAEASDDLAILVLHWIGPLARP